LFFSIPAFPEKLWIHAENVRSHTAKVLINFLAFNEMKKNPSSTSFSRLSTLGLFLSGYMKRNLIVYCAKNLSELLLRIQVILRAVPGETLVEIFLE
jgi:intein/homing endonuclease